MAKDEAARIKAYVFEPNSAPAIHLAGDGFDDCRRNECHGGWGLFYLISGDAGNGGAAGAGECDEYGGVVAGATDVAGDAAWGRTQGTTGDSSSYLAGRRREWRGGLAAYQANYVSSPDSMVDSGRYADLWAERTSIEMDARKSGKGGCVGGRAEDTAGLVGAGAASGNVLHRIFRGGRWISGDDDPVAVRDGEDASIERDEGGGGAIVKLLRDRDVCADGGDCMALLLDFSGICRFWRVDWSEICKADQWRRVAGDRGGDGMRDCDVFLLAAGVAW